LVPGNPIVAALLSGVLILPALFTLGLLNDSVETPTSGAAMIVAGSAALVISWHLIGRALRRGGHIYKRTALSALPSA